jgi:anaerobic selenocysteine-containing dehydrogenase
MQRRDFIRLSAITGATATLDSCGQPDVQLIRFIPEEELTPGVATWRPSLCTLCPAGCGTLAKVMEGDAEVVRNGKLGIMKMGLAKKIEGNPRHPINQGKLCARGQAMLQVTYHPDRIRGPLKRTGPRGSGQFQEISWDDAIKEVVEKIAALRSGQQSASLAFLAGAMRGLRRELVEQFLATLGAPPTITFEALDDAVLRKANELSWGRPQLPTLDFGRCNYILSFGADFLGTWNSPVAQSIAYGAMRNGRPGQRGKFVQIEPRLSLTGASADEWIPVRPGTEGVLALGFAHVILQEKLAVPKASEASSKLIAGWPEGLPEYAPAIVENRTGVPAATIARLAREAANARPGAALIGGAPLAQTNGLFQALAVNALQGLLGAPGNGDQPSPLDFTPTRSRTGAASGAPLTSAQGSFSLVQSLAQEILLNRPHSPSVLLLAETNPVFALPPAVHLREALEKVPFIASFSSFLDETSALADVILPDHSPLESWLDDNPESGTTQTVASLAPPALRPLHNTRAMPDVLLEIARQLGEDVSSALPWKTFEDMLKGRFAGLHAQSGTGTATDAEAFWKKAQDLGGWWGPEEKPTAKLRPPSAAREPVKLSDPQFDGDPNGFPFYFLPFASPAFYDGSTSHLPWLQETPDPLSTAMWGAWVEINPQTAARLGIKQSDLVEVASQHAKLQAPVLINPGIAPDVIAMPIGQGHENFTRYASGRGANPLSILAPMAVPETGSLAWAATRVKVTKVGEGKLTRFGAELREQPHEHR